MNNSGTQPLIDELVGSAHVFVAAVSGVLKQTILTDIAGDQLTMSQLKVLKLLELTEAHNVGDVAAFLGVSDAAASKTVDRLVRQKYMRRTEATDRRSSELSLAAAGRKILNRYEAAKSRKLSALFGDLPAEDLKRTAEFLEHLTKGIVSDSANPDEICLQCGIYLKKRCLVRDAARADCSYQVRKTKRLTKINATQTKVTTRGGPRVGPPG